MNAGGRIDEAVTLTDPLDEVWGASPRTLPPLNRRR
ncbi:hypothetical protein ABH915_001161 [Arthrobacter sp. MW3 TE3886]